MQNKSTATGLLFFSVTLRKNKRNLEKLLADANARLKIFCMEMEIGFIDKKNLKSSFC